MRKFKGFLTSLLIAAAMAVPLPAYATDIQNTLILLQINNPDMYADGVEKEIDEGLGTAPVIDNGRTLLPVRSVVEEIGGTVGWEQNTQTVTLNYKSDEIKLAINSEKAYLNGKENILDTAPKIINGRTMLPIRFVAESFGFRVFWDGTNSVITITNASEPGDVKIPENWLLTPEDKADGDLNVHFIDVGQGDAVFIELPNGKTMLIDAGPSAGTVSGYIRSKGYNVIDYVVATHPDADHINGMLEVLETFGVGTFYMPEKEHTTQIFGKMLDAVSANGCAAEYAFAGKSIIDTGNLKVYFIGPVRICEDNNNCSAVIKIEYKEISMLFTGDAEYSEENDILSSGYDVSADILKVGHHGSSSSSSPEFIAAVNPKTAVISVGAGNKYGHPTNEVLAVLNNAGINIYRTDESGTVVITSDGVNYTINTLRSVVQPNAPPQTDNAQSGNDESRQREAAEQNSSAVVYRTKTGSKYHNAGCSYLKSSIQTTVSEAKSMGLTPCSRCNPPR